MSGYFDIGPQSTTASGCDHAVSAPSPKPHPEVVIGSSLGTAVAGTILVAGITATPERSYALAMIAIAVVGVLGLIAAVLLPAEVRTVSVRDAPQESPGDRR